MRVEGGPLMPTGLVAGTVGPVDVAVVACDGNRGLLGAMARTTAVSGTATAVSGRVQRSAAQVPVAAPPPVDRIAQLTQLAELKTQGVPSEAEFASEKARILAS